MRTSFAVVYLEGPDHVAGAALVAANEAGGFLYPVGDGAIDDERGAVTAGHERLARAIFQFTLMARAQLNGGES